jgi:hypothetical protein
MKNIHIIATDKPSRLSKDENDRIWLSINFEYGINDNNKQNIYITSDEEIKEGDWIYYTLASGYCKTTVSSKGLKQKGIPAKKIILTTDQDLIKEGVQSIDDEFLEWFVKNPSCECVEVDKNWNYPLDKSWEYKIIIPQEEPKPETFIKSDNIEGQWLSPVQTERTWQEEQLVKIFGHYPNASPRWQYMNGLIQDSLDAKTMYSEEDMIEFGKYLLQLSNSAMSRKFNMKMLDSETGIKLTKDLFEQYKKK